MEDTNYALETGIRSVPGAITFASVYTLLLGWFIYMSFRNPVHVHFALVGYCSLSVVAFSLRAVLASSDMYGQNLDMLNAEQILLTIGFLILLYSSHTLGLDLKKQGIPSDQHVLEKPFVRFLGSHRIFHFFLLAAVALTIADGVPSNIAMAWIIVFQTIVYASMELNREHRTLHKNDRSFGNKYAVFILLVITLLFFKTEMFEMVLVHNYDKGNNEDYLYPLVAVPELLAVLLYAIPGLVPAVCPEKMRVRIWCCCRRKTRVNEAEEVKAQA